MGTAVASGGGCYGCWVAMETAAAAEVNGTIRLVETGFAVVLGRLAGCDIGGNRNVQWGTTRRLTPDER